MEKTIAAQNVLPIKIGKNSIKGGVKNKEVVVSKLKQFKEILNENMKKEKKSFNLAEKDIKEGKTIDKKTTELLKKVKKREKKLDVNSEMDLKGVIFSLTKGEISKEDFVNRVSKLLNSETSKIGAEELLKDGNKRDLLGKEGTVKNGNLKVKKTRSKKQNETKVKAKNVNIEREDLSIDQKLKRALKLEKIKKSKDQIKNIDLNQKEIKLKNGLIPKEKEIKTTKKTKQTVIEKKKPVQNEIKLKSDLIPKEKEIKTAKKSKQTVIENKKPVQNELKLKSGLIPKEKEIKTKKKLEQTVIEKKKPVQNELKLKSGLIPKEKEIKTKKKLEQTVIEKKKPVQKEIKLKNKLIPKEKEIKTTKKPEQAVIEKKKPVKNEIKLKSDLIPKEKEIKTTKKPKQTVIEKRKPVKNEIKLKSDLISKEKEIKTTKKPEQAVIEKKKTVKNEIKLKSDLIPKEKEIKTTKKPKQTVIEKRKPVKNEIKLKSDLIPKEKEIKTTKKPEQTVIEKKKPVKNEIKLKSDLIPKEKEIKTKKKLEQTVIEKKKPVQKEITSEKILEDVKGIKEGFKQNNVSVAEKKSKESPIAIENLEVIKGTANESIVLKNNINNKGNKLKQKKETYNGFLNGEIKEDKLNVLKEKILENPKINNEKDLEVKFSDDKIENRSNKIKFDRKVFNADIKKVTLKKYGFKKIERKKIETDNIISRDNTNIMKDNNIKAEPKKVIQQNTKLNYTNILEQVENGIKMNFNSSTKEMKIKLHPEELGELEIKIRIEHNIMKAEFVVDNQKVKEILENNFNNLRNNLNDKGFSGAEINVTISNGNFQENRNGKKEKVNDFFKKKNKISSSEIDINSENIDVNSKYDYITNEGISILA
ncbi:flagellar hook-length control protein FliK [Haliovirga abyssi]|uniref:Flagellar hook-length control protein-like C-terminal domain-containing protein n=1 Tax=Haliovirga abyssi TaxID=2996794 RepID=A0AAU9DFF5_9FUSO|nr:flagellar hook-length control protein FliK [Haliovirga abyssi]BDU50107.1 hypothetical protein HLVA_06760 [Haliovirga abyssi]